jgi:phage-related protein
MPIKEFLDKKGGGKNLFFTQPSRRKFWPHVSRDKV